MAAADALQRQPPAADRAVIFDRLQRVGRAGRVVSAMPAHERAQEPPVQVDGNLREPARHAGRSSARQCCARLSNTARFPAFAAAARAVTSTSTAGISCRCNRNDSRIRRRRRFRLTALPAARRPTAMPSRASRFSFFTHWTTNKSSVRRLRARRARSNSAAVWSLWPARNPNRRGVSRSSAAFGDGEALAALRTPALQDLAALLRGHARAEAVRALALQLAGLVGAL